MTHEHLCHQIIQTSACEYTEALNQNMSHHVSVYESELWDLLPHRNTASANTVIHVASLAVRVTDYWQVNLPEKHRHDSSGAFSCKWSLWRSAVSLATMLPTSPPPEPSRAIPSHPELRWWRHWNQMTLFIVIYIRSFSSYCENQCNV